MLEQSSIPENKVWQNCLLQGVIIAVQTLEYYWEAGKYLRGCRFTFPSIAAAPENLQGAAHCGLSPACNMIPPPVA